MMPIALPQRLSLCLCLSLLASTAMAAPEYYRVTGVAADDTLNVRAAPDGSSEDIGDLLPDTTGLEVLDRDDSGKWGRITWYEGNGWISMRFLEKDDIARIGQTTLPAGLLCGGTEPFWSIRFAETTATFSDITSNHSVLPLGDTLVAGGRPAFPAALRHRSDEAAALSILRPQACSDGMSDRDYGYSVVLLIRTLQGEGFYEGCCWLPLETGQH